MKVNMCFEIDEKMQEAFDRWSQKAYGNVIVAVQQCLEAAVVSQILEWENGESKLARENEPSGMD